MNNKSNLIDAASNKIIDKIEKNNRLRKEIINYTNNFREYKLLKTDIVERLLENENDLRQLNLIVKSLTNQSNLQKEKIFSLENDLKNTKDQLLITVEKKEEMEKINESIKYENDEKDIFIHELLTKLNFLESIVREYQTKIYISKYDKILSYKSPFKNDENFKKFYDKFIPTNYKYPFFLLNSNSRNSISKKIEGSPEILDKLKKENVKNIMKTRPRSTSAFLIDNNNNNLNLNSNLNSNSNSNSNFNISPSISPEEKKNINSSLNKYFSLNGINLKNRNSVNSGSRIGLSEIQRIQLNNNNNLSNKYSSYNNINNNKNDLDINNINNNNNLKYNDNNNELDTEEVYRKIVISSNGFKSTGAESNFNNNNTQKLFYESNSNNFNEDKTNINIDLISKNSNIINNNNNNYNNDIEIVNNLSPVIKNSPEKERANFVSNLLLKIFSKSHVLRILKRKFGENFEIKLTDKEVDPNFLLILEEEVDELLKKEKQKEFMVNERMEANRSKKKVRPSFIRSISPPNENRGGRKAFNNYTKNASGYFDPKYQYGGESKVPSSVRSRSNSSTGFSPNNRRGKVPSSVRSRSNSSTGFSPNNRRGDLALRNSSIDFTLNNRQSLGAGSVLNDLISGIDK
jgi:hypothetical protein